MGNALRRRGIAALLVLVFGQVVVSFSAFGDDSTAKQNKKTCEDAEKAAQQACSDSAPPAQQAQQQQNQQSQNQGGSSQQNCNQQNNILPALLGMLGALKGGCEKAQADCKQKCAKAQQSPSTDCNDSQPPSPKAASCKTAAQDASQTGSSDTGKCQQLDQNIAKMAQMIAKALADLAAAQQCQQQTNLDCTNGSIAAANPTKCPTFNCNLDQYKNDPKCVCERNPRGCDGMGNPIPEAAAVTKPNATTTDMGSPNTAKPNTGTQSSPMTGNPLQSGGLSGSGGGGGGKQGLVEKAASARDGVPTKPDPTAINAGDYGSGGNGIKGGSGFPDPAAAARGPAGKKILSRAEQRRLESRDGFTGANGRSNWEKISNRYRDNQPSFTP